MTPQELARALRAPLFADRPDLQTAIDDAYAIINAISSRDRIAALTALHIVTNTIANTLEESCETN
jgi:hypothetical protein